MAAVAAPYSFLFGGLVRFCGGRLLMPMDKKRAEKRPAGKNALSAVDGKGACFILPFASRGRRRLPGPA